LTRRDVIRAASRLSVAIGRRIRYDGASFIGSTLCMLSLFLPWVLREFPLWYRSPPAPGYVHWPAPKMEWSFIDLFSQSDFTVILLVFLVGMVASLFFRLGVVLQAVGTLCFAFTAHLHFLPARYGVIVDYDPFHQYFLGPGYFVALIGVFISMFGSRNFWWQRNSHPVIPTISRMTALLPNSTRAPR